MNVWADKLDDMRFSLNDVYMILLMTGWMLLFMGIYYNHFGAGLFGLVLVIVNLDPSNAQATVVHWNMELLGLSGDSFVVDDQLTGNTFSWTRDSFVSLDPRADFNNVAHLAVVRIT